MTVHYRAMIKLKKKSISNDLLSILILIVAIALPSIK